MLCYHIWTIGCQMNKAESEHIARYLETLGYEATPAIEDADLVVLNTCMVRQSAEDKVLGTLGYLKGIRGVNRRMSILVTGCFVNSCVEELERHFPYVDLFFKPGGYQELADWAEGRVKTKYAARATLPLIKQEAPCAFVPIIQGCNNFCSYCIVPYRRGRERSRSLDEIICEVNELTERGVKEVTLLGQNVNSYGHDLLGQPSLSDLLTELNSIDHLERIRFLTNHPKDMSRKLIAAIASLDKICEHITLPLQAGDDDILKAMRRGYTIEQYRGLVDMIRSHVANVSLSTDVIVGFPGEGDEQFGRTLTLLEEIRFDSVHVAVYSPRPGTIASRKYIDDVLPEVKKERLDRLEALQARIAGEINSQLRGRTVQVLVEGEKRGKWYGRARSNKLVFFQDSGDHLGRLINIKVGKASPWALQGQVSSEDERNNSRHQVTTHV
jgi:tRNA-2-methylthio-N6-dimethylallyladenosine synthase